MPIIFIAVLLKDEVKGSGFLGTGNGKLGIGKKVRYTSLI
jgi:hypothetical protein